VSLPRSYGFRFPGATAFTDDDDVSGSDADADSRRVSGEIIRTSRGGPNTACCNGSSVPSVVTEDAIRFGNCVPAFDIVQGSAVLLASFDVLAIEFCLELARLRI
jgi:hypothetical protein